MHPLDILGRELRYAARVLRSHWFVTCLCVLLLGLGSGANLTVFGLYRSILLHDVSGVQPDRLVLLEVGEARQVSASQYTSVGDLPGFQAVAGFSSSLNDRVNWGRSDGIVPLSYSVVTPNYFQVLGASAAAGRLFEPGDTGARRAVVSEAFSRTHLGAERTAVGRMLDLNGAVYEIVGVLPRGFRSADAHGRVPQVFVPGAPAGAPERDFRSDVSFVLLGRLADGVSRSQATEMVRARVQGSDAFRAADSKRSVPARLVAAGGLEKVRSDPDQSLLFLALTAVLASVLFVLVIATANVAGLLLARGAARRKEIVVRLALGATRGQIMRQLLVETTLLALAGAVAGVLVHVWLARLLASTRLPVTLPFDVVVDTDLPLLGYALLLLAVTAVLAGVLPAVAAGRVRPLPMLQPPAVRRLPVGRFLVGAEIAVSIVLLVPALLFVRAAIRVSAVDPGFDAANTVAVNVRRGGAPLPAAAAQARYGSLLHTLQTTAGVQRVASVGFLPLSFFEWSPDLRNSADGSRLRASAQSVGAGYFSAMGIRVSGREFEPADCARSETLAIVNETFARRYFPGDSPLTKTVGLVSGPANRRTEQRLEIVGVVGDSKYMTLGEGPRPVLYRPHCTAGDAVTFVVRSGEQSRNLITIVRRRLTEIDATSTVDVVPLAEHVGAAAWPGRAAAGLLTALAIVGLTLAMAGAYGALSFSVARRTSELAIRMSIGGTRGSVMRMVVLDGLRTVAVGTALGLAGAAALMSPLRDLLPHGLTATDPVTYCSVAGIMLAVGLAASAIPSYRAMNTNVVQALRAE